MDHQDSVVLITGAAGHLGRAVAREFAAQGARLALLDVSAEALQAAFQANAGTLLLPVDLLDAARTGAAVEQAIAHFGRIDALAALAGGFAMGEPVHALSDDSWQAMQDMNVRTLLNAVRATVPAMLAQGRGRIVTVGALSAQRGLAHMGAYGASKSAVMRLTESLSAELRERGINVNCVLPSILDTAANRQAMPQADFSRWVAPADLARVIAFLASEQARAIHGACLPVAGLS